MTIRGAVNARLEPRIDITVQAEDGSLHSIEAVLDTGFTGALTMPGNLVQFLRLTPSGVRTVTLADGEDQDVNSYVTSVSWLGRLREVAVYQLETDPLIGTSLLVGCRVSLEVAEGGAVLIDELTGQ